MPTTLQARPARAPDPAADALPVAAPAALPGRMATPAAILASASASPPAEAAPVKILLVDDLASNLESLKALLSLPGPRLRDDAHSAVPGDGVGSSREDASPAVEVLTAQSGPQALELLLQHEVALALLDVQMPGMDGYSLAELMRGSERTRGVPIIFLTAAIHQPHESFRGYASGAVDFLYKPVDERVLRGKVQVFVELYRQRQTIAEHAAQLARLSHANALMLAALSNDIREPLAALALGSELLVKRSESPALQQAARRQKAATALLRRQVDHLINLAKAPALDLRPQFRETDLAQVARLRWCEHDEFAPPHGAGRFDVRGDTCGHWDAGLLSAAIEHLLLQARTHGGDAVHLEVDGQARSLVALRIRFASALSRAAALHLLGAGHSSADGLPPPVGEGLRPAERVARAHGGSLLARTRAREGVSFEMLLPRGLPDTAPA
jgi:two-component system, sensor histidine kinase and response regulator